MLRIYKTEAIILKRINFAEADKLVTVFSKDLGKLTLLAKGVRRVYSRRSPHLELFNQVHLSVYRGKTWDIVTHAQSLEVYEYLKNDLGRIALAYTIAEIIDLLCPERQEQRGVYELLLSALANLNRPNGIIKDIDLKVSKSLLLELGFTSDRQNNCDFDSFHYIETLAEKRLRSLEFLRHLQGKTRVKH